MPANAVLSVRPYPFWQHRRLLGSHPSLYRLNRGQSALHEASTPSHAVIACWRNGHSHASMIEAGAKYYKVAKNVTTLLLKRLAEAVPVHIPPKEDLLILLMQQWLAAASCVLSLVLLLATIVAGWLALWHSTLKDINFFREILGLNRPRPDVSAQRQEAMKAEIEKIKRQHSRSHSRSSSFRKSTSCFTPGQPEQQST